MITWKRLTEEQKQNLEDGSSTVGFGLLSNYLELFPNIDKRYTSHWFYLFVIFIISIQIHHITGHF